MLDVSGVLLCSRLQDVSILTDVNDGGCDRTRYLFDTKLVC
jgi:hypothetical protein